MGIFWESAQPTTRARTVEAFRAALGRDPASIEDPQGEAEAQADAVSSSKDQKFKVGRFVGALLVFTAVAVGAIVTDATDLGDSSKALWGFAATIFGVVVGLLGGEKSA